MEKLKIKTNNSQYEGLSDMEVLINLAASGKNILTQYEKTSWIIIKDVLSDLMMLILVLACSIYFFTSSYREAIILTTPIIAIAAISIFQRVRTEHAMKTLRKLSQPFTTAIRSGKKHL